MYIAVYKFIDSEELDRDFHDIGDAMLWFDVNYDFFDYCTIYDNYETIIKEF